MHYAITYRYAWTKSISVNPNPNPIWIVASARQSLNWDPWILFSFQGKDECAFCCVLIATFAIKNVSGSLPHRQRVDKNCFPVCVRKKINKTSFYLANDLYGYWEVMETTTVKQKATVQRTQTLSFVRYILTTLRWQSEKTLASLSRCLWGIFSRLLGWYGHCWVAGARWFAWNQGNKL